MSSSRFQSLSDEQWERIERCCHRTRVVVVLLAHAEGKIDWTVSIDATINRAHQHATNTTRPEQDTGGTSESHESA